MLNPVASGIKFVNFLRTLLVIIFLIGCAGATWYFVGLGMDKIKQMKEDEADRQLLIELNKKQQEKLQNEQREIEQDKAEQEEADKLTKELEEQSKEFKLLEMHLNELNPTIDEIMKALKEFDEAQLKNDTKAMDEAESKITKAVAKANKIVDELEGKKK